jgi:hypothetical protein
MTLRPSALAVLALILLLTSSVALEALRDGGERADGPITFTGRWSAAGRRQTLATEGEGVASIVSVAGAVVITSGGGIGRGFHGEAIALGDERHVSVGRALWTDSHGDRVFSVLNEVRLEPGRRIHGTITGGTGRYAGLTGAYSFTWQYVTAGEGDAVQGRTADLEGWYRWPR